MKNGNYNKAHRQEQKTHRWHKEAHKQSIIEMLRVRDRLSNEEVQRLLSISEDTASVYLDELVREGLLQPHEDVQRGLYYTLS